MIRNRCDTSRILWGWSSLYVIMLLLRTGTLSPSPLYAFAHACALHALMICYTTNQVGLAMQNVIAFIVVCKYMIVCALQVPPQLFYGLADRIDTTAVDATLARMKAIWESMQVVEQLLANPKRDIHPSCMCRVIPYRAPVGRFFVMCACFRYRALAQASSHAEAWLGCTLRA